MWDSMLSLTMLAYESITVRPITRINYLDLRVPTPGAYSVRIERISALSEARAN
jgi:hypothetical protein